VAAREQGEHPARVWVLWGDDWGRRPSGALCVSPRDPDLDWACCLGLPVHLVARCGEDFAAVAAQIAVSAAPVICHWPAATWDDWLYWAADGRRAQADIADLADAARGWSIQSWPTWWSDDLERDYRARRELYLEALCHDASAAMARTRTPA
jgi:hypothetical protein